MQRKLILRFAAGALTACLTAAASAQGMNASAPTAGSESMSQHVDDATVTTKVKAELLGAKDVKSAHIHVKTLKGVVWLTGTVPSAADRDSAQKVVEGVTGVMSVKNRLKISNE